MKKTFLSILFLLLFISIIGIQLLYDQEQNKNAFAEPLILKPELVKAIDLGLHNASADLLWLSAIQYFGGGESKTNQKLVDYLNNATDLDPQFAYPYAFGALILPSTGETDQGIALAKKGINNNVQDWRVSYYLATTYYLIKKDDQNAAKYFDLAASTKGAPEGISKVAANFGTRSDTRSKTKQIWTGIYESSNDEIIKERAKNYIIHLEILDLLDQSITKYKENYKKDPVTINDLVQGKILIAIPPDPFGFEYTINEGKLGVK